MIDCFIYKSWIFPLDEFNKDIITLYKQKKLSPIFAYYIRLEHLPVEIRRDECIFTNIKTAKDEYPECFI